MEKNKSDLGINRIIQEYKGSRVEMSIPVIGVDVDEFMEMVTGFMMATGWHLDTIRTGLESAADEIKEKIKDIGGKDDNDN